VASLDTAGRRLAHFYAALPFNLIPASDVLRYGFAFGGPCGAKSRLLVALLRSQGYSARLTGLSTADFVPLHTLVEVQLEGEWVPLDPTYNVYFEGPEGHLAATHEVASRPDVFERGGRRAHDYPIETYTYVNVSRLSVFYVIQRSLRAISLASNEGSPELYSRLNRVVPDSVLQYDLGLPYLYEEPELLAASGFAGISLLIAFLSRHRSRRAPAARSQARP
jgi:transglutaminase-like putative cysteine protease